LKDIGIPAGFLPGYGLNGNRQMKPFFVLLKETGCRISATRLITRRFLDKWDFALIRFEGRWTFENCSEYRY